MPGPNPSGGHLSRPGREGPTLPGGTERDEDGRAIARARDGPSQVALEIAFRERLENADKEVVQIASYPKIQRLADFEMRRPPAQIRLRSTATSLLAIKWPPSWNAMAT